MRAAGRESAPRSAQTPPLVDPRVAKHGGIRKDPKANYDFPGMLDRRSWAKTLVHQHSVYGCGICGTRFSSPHAVYTHLAKRHDR
jgi:hypothetical protein